MKKVNEELKQEVIKLAKESLSLGDKIGFFMLVIAIFLSGWFINDAKSIFSPKPLTYEKAVKEWNANVAKGVYGSRINDEDLIYSIDDNGFCYYEKYPESNDIYMNCNYEYSLATIIHTKSHAVTQSWIKTSLIKPVHSNWGLTQDVWALDDKITAMSKDKRHVLNDNPSIRNK